MYGVLQHALREPQTGNHVGKWLELESTRSAREQHGKGGTTCLGRWEEHSTQTLSRLHVSTIENFFAEPAPG